jgi:hypothetical protein
MRTQQTQLLVPPVPPRPAVRPRPNRMGYVVGALIAVAGLIGGLVWGFSAYDAYRDDIVAFPRVSVPGTESVRLAAGDYVVYYEAGGLRPSEVAVTVADAAGETIALTTYDADVRYDAPDGTVGRAFAQFSVASAGTHSVTVEAEQQAAQVAIGTRITSSMIVAVFGALSLVIITAVIGLVIIVTTAARRRR